MIDPNHPNHVVKQKFVEALFANDWETFASLSHPEMELHEPKGLPYAGVWKGVDGFKACWEKIREGTLITEHLEIVRTYFAEGPNHMVDLLHTKGKVRATGEPFDTFVYEQWELKDGKIYRIILYWFEMPDFGPQ